MATTQNNEKMIPMNELMDQIQEATRKQKSQSIVDENRVMRSMLNDPNYVVGIYDKKKGKIGQRCPREEAVTFVAESTAAITGLDKKTSKELANKYEFTKKDATFFLNNTRDFMGTYLKTGRKINIVQGEDCECSLLLKPVPSKEKLVPNGTNGDRVKTIVPAFNKIISKSKAPVYIQN